MSKADKPREADGADALWAHEVLRVFYDRLIDDDDRDHGSTR